MTYLSKLSGHQMAIIGPSVEAAQALLPGQEIKVKFRTPEFTAKARYWIYSYLSINNLKDLYRIRRVNTVEFAICRKEEEECVLTIPAYNKAESFVMDHLLDVDEESEALKCIADSDLDSESKLLALAEWKRINS